ncbi:hypothetical protein [Nocardioides litoris]|uniref:hypothetical protein n=1 Tax=Nocardioides litoris TaxID=1926648 RepID=UPI001476961A|nr:hypothetical protein [Nocardioides litoris]
MPEPRSTAPRRWAVVAVVAALLVAGPLAWRARPVAADDATAAVVAERVRASADASWSGLVETSGALQLPAADELSDLGRLLGERTRLRAWWQDDRRWRVDELLPAGEHGLRRDGVGLVSWDFERDRATVSRDPDVRLPRSSDVLPPALARRVLDGVGDDDLERLSDERVAGRTALGLRVRPPSPLSSIDHVDLWADRETGVALRVEVYADGQAAPSFTTAFVEHDPGRPDDAEVGPVTGQRVDVEYDEALDIADAANQYAPLRPPGSLVGLPQAEATDGAVGVFGAGTTQLVTIPLRGREAEPFREQLQAVPGAAVTAERTVAAVGPLTVAITGSDDGGLLLAGWVTPEAMGRAAAEAVAGYEYTGDR